MSSVPPSAPSATSFPFFEEAVQAGFPSPAAGDLHGHLDLTELCVKHPQATYFLRARGESMIGAGISDGDVLVVDRALQARNGDIVIASVHGEFTVKRLEMGEHRVRLVAENPLFQAIEIDADSDAEFFGVVSSVVKMLR
ncbi:MAG: translesion error-prone DNA polymerase V autoproteolytic subunit [Akkermansia sp.]